jgi:hypothetical protein
VYEFATDISAFGADPRPIVILPTRPYAHLVREILAGVDAAGSWTVISVAGCRVRLLG